jgi:hypothetical protein
MRLSLCTWSREQALHGRSKKISLLFSSLSPSSPLFAIYRPHVLFLVLSFIIFTGHPKGASFSTYTISMYVMNRTKMIVNSELSIGYCLDIRTPEKKAILPAAEPFADPQPSPQPSPQSSPQSSTQPSPKPIPQLSPKPSTCPRGDKYRKRSCGAQHSGRYGCDAGYTKMINNNLEPATANQERLSHFQPSSNNINVPTAAASTGPRHSAFTKSKDTPATEDDFEY